MDETRGRNTLIIDFNFLWRAKVCSVRPQPKIGNQVVPLPKSRVDPTVVLAHAGECVLRAGEDNAVPRKDMEDLSAKSAATVAGGTSSLAFFAKYSKH